MDPNKTQEILKVCIEHYNNYGIKPVLVRQQLTEVQTIVEKEKKRLGIKHPRITMEEIGFQEIQKEDNLYNLAKDNKIKITKISSNTHNKITIKLKSKTPQLFTLEAGTMLFPDEPIATSTQSLIIRDDASTTVSENESELEFSTYCFNQELRSPKIETFYLGNIKSNRYQKGMNQS
jgi:hypothetical protein